MKKEYSYGAIIYRQEKKKLLFLLIYSARNRIWGFPKGHIEKGESEKEAAIREIAEETGISALRFVEGFREEDIYPALSNRKPNKGTAIEKHSVYYLCETKSAKVIVDGSEITDHAWMSMRDAKKLLPFDHLQQLLEKADAHTKNNKETVV
ncbi:MAG: NUDIX domain-containing protein [Candidatus Omnitrophota bacterium]